MWRSGLDKGGKCHPEFSGYFAVMREKTLLPHRTLAEAERLQNLSLPVRQTYQIQAGRQVANVVAAAGATLNARICQYQ